jgi:hypothetical protein
MKFAFADSVDAFVRRSASARGALQSSFRREPHVEHIAYPHPDSIRHYIVRIIPPGKQSSGPVPLANLSRDTSPEDDQRGDLWPPPYILYQRRLVCGIMQSPENNVEISGNGDVRAVVSSQLLHLSARTRCRWSLRFQVSYLTLLFRRTNRFGPVDFLPRIFAEVAALRH